MEKLVGKTAVVTGAASGMGLAMARRFAREEMNVVLSDIDESKLDAAVTEIQADGGNAQGVVTDVSLESDNVQLLDA
ncbi:MAG TPA: alcohol dehydrogenase, partial [Acidimicrobiaceae bacterium]|nr:alcohol dehydrogenase [Acidimicrobiaceae bacterium]